jgi:hypothetical protein
MLVGFLRVQLARYPVPVSCSVSGSYRFQGKTLSILCSLSKFLDEYRRHSGVTPSPSGRFTCSRFQVGDADDEELMEYVPITPVKQIVLSTRTHSQIKQIVSEVRRPGWNYPFSISVLGSRSFMCINEQIRNSHVSLSFLFDITFYSCSSRM